MQHHVHANAVRRATHHHGHHQNLGHAHHMAMHPGLEQQPPPPQPQQPQAAHARLNHHHQQQQQQQQHQQPGTGGTAVYHHNNAGNINGSSNNNNNNNNNNNSNNNQMQKIRQQHQHLNNNNNNNNIGNNNNSNSSNGHSGKCHNHPPPPLPQAYNQLTYNQLPPPPPPGTHPQHPHMAAAHLSSYAPHPPPPTHYYMSQAKPSKYNNNNNSNNNAHYSANTNNNNNSNSNSTNYAPKTILQNTYRQSKVNGQQLSAHSVQEANSNNIIITTEAVVVAAAGAAGEETIEQCPVGPPPPPQLSELPVEIPIDGDKCSSSSSLSTDIQPQIDSTLPNEDHGVSASGRNGKDKTPMCLVNELARYNKITHQYRLTGERGPAHCKTFTVTLKLGDEEYSADGFKIKKAQHLAASKAIEETKYKHPPPKIRRSESEGSSSRTHITPTVELNALAMKLGQRTYYLLDPTQIPPADAAMQMPLPPEYGGVSLLPTPAAAAAAAAAAGLTQQQQQQQQPQQQPISIAPPPPAFIRRQFVQLGGPPMHPHGIYGGHQRTGQYPAKYHASRYALPPPPPHLMHGAYGAHHTPMPVTPSKITLFVGKQKFVGTGRTLQQAKHDAAARALQVLKTQASATATSASDEALEDSMDEGDKKSPISQVHEIGIKRSMTVHFKVLREEGPAHMKNFITACIVGSIVTEGEGNGKKISKKRSAEKMLIELHKLPPLTPTKQTPMKRIKVKTPGKNSSSSGTATTDPTATPLPGKLERRKRLSAPNKEKLLEQLDDAENPITKLIQLQQNRKDKEPIFELIAKNGNDTSRRREFVMEVSANGSTARGTGNSKKLAKRNAAQALLELLEAAEPAINVKSQNTKETSITATGATKDLVTVAAGVDVPMVSTPAGPVPGILILRQNKKPSKKKASMEAKEDGKEKGKESTTKTAPAAATTTVTAAATVTTPTAVVTAATEAAGTTNVAANATETSSSESLLNTSTGSNTSGVSSNSSNTGATTNSTSTSNTTSNSNSSTSSSNIAGVHMKEQLLYLSKLLDFEVNFSDYPKGNHNEFLTIVTLSTNPPQICHGVGKSSEESQNDAARSALKILSELGLNNAKK